MGKKFSYRQDIEQIREYMKLSPEEKLQWLYEANEFNREALTEKTKRVRDYFRNEEYKKRP